MRTIAATLLVLFAAAAFADEPEIPKMTKEEALAYVKAEQLSLNPTNLVVPIMNGNAELVEALLSAGVDVNDTESLPKPAMRLAMSTCAGKKLETEQILTMMEVLFAHGAKVNVPGEKELSALMVASQWCPAPVVRRLLKADADMNFKTSLGISPLSMAFIMNNLDAAEVMIESGARLSAEAAGKLLEDKTDDARRVALIKKAQKK